MCIMKFARFMAASALATSCIVATPAFAQGQAKKTDSPAKEEKEEAGEIVVVGSLLRQKEFDSVSPVQVITREETTAAGFASTAKALQSTAVTGGTAQINNAFGGFVTEGGPGANTISLRGLGASRSLVLLNGRRLAPAGTRGAVGSADLNVLPNAIIDHYEILKDGASSIYGSDAVAGVLNVITKKKIDGLTVEGQYNAPTHKGGQEQRLSMVVGLNGDRFNISASFDYYKRNNLTLGDRSWTRCNTDYRINHATTGVPGSADFIDPLTGQPKCYPITGTGSNGVTINTIGTNTRSGIGAAGSIAPGTTANFNRWRPNSSITTGLIGFEGVGGGANNLNVRDTFDPRTLNRSLISPAKGYSAYVQAGYDLHALGDAEAYVEFLASRRESTQVGFRQLSLDYNSGSPLIPAGLLTGNFSGPQATSGGRNVGVRAFIGFGNDQSSQQVTYWKAGGGLRGDFFVPGWRYDLYFSHSSSDASYTFNSFITSRLTRSLDAVSNGAGGFVCRNPADGCIAAPALSSAVIAGNLPQNWKDYIFVPVTGQTKYKEDVANLTVDGKLFALPYGDVKAAFGAEFRKAKIDDTPSSASQASDLYNFTSSAPTRGKDSVWEVYGEVEVPLVRNVPLVHELKLDVSARYTHYDSYGGDKTYKLGGIYSPFKWLSFRASYGTSYRAPALYEQFLGATSGFLSSTVDPCNNYDAPGVNPTRAANCRAEGLPAGFTATSGVTVVSAGGAAAGLAAETSKNLTLGVILQPKFGSGFGDLSVAVDYYDIKVNNGVSRAGATGILSLCYDDPQFRAGGGFCRLINARNPSSQALTVNDSYVNLSQDIVRGFDFTVRYARDIGPGKFRVNATATRFLDQSNRLFATDPLDDLNGTINNPKWAGNFDFAYTYKKWRLFYSLEWIQGTSSYNYYGLDPAVTAFKLDVPDYYQHQVSLRYRANSKLEVTAGVRNIFDKNPPQISSGVYSRVGNSPLYSGYDYVGRTVFVNISKSF
jgi:iron complex outermembrane recepter protein